jgi:branched-chain amino acid transport system permease protein
MKLELLLYHASFAGIAVLLTQSLSLVWRSNRFSLGHHGYFAIGAYAAGALLKWTLPAGRSAPAGLADRLNGLLLLVFCLAGAALIAAMIGQLTFRLFARLRQDHFAVATLIFAEIVQNVLANWNYVGGALGLEVPYLVVRNGGDERLWYVCFYASLLAACNAVLYFAIARLNRSTYGLYLAAVKDDELAAELCGVDVLGLQRVIFTLACGVAGLAGGLFLHFSTLIVPADFSFVAGLPVILYVVLGGNSNGRAVVAALALYAGYEIIKLRFFGLFGEDLGKLAAEWKEALLAAVLIAAMVVPALLSRRKQP